MAKQTAEELKEKARLALQDAQLVDIVRAAPANARGQVNLTWIYLRAEQHVHGATGDLQQTKRLAVAARFLGMLRRDFPGEFDAFVQDVVLRASNKSKALFGTMEIALPNFCDAEFITREEQLHPTGSYRKQYTLRFKEWMTPWSSMTLAWEFCRKILDAILQSANFDPEIMVGSMENEKDPRTRTRAKEERLRALARIKSELLQMAREYGCLDKEDSSPSQ